MFLFLIFICLLVFVCLIVDCCFWGFGGELQVWVFIACIGVLMVCLYKFLSLLL